MEKVWLYILDPVRWVGSSKPRQNHGSVWHIELCGAFSLGFLPFPFPRNSSYLLNLREVCQLAILAGKPSPLRCHLWTHCHLLQHTYLCVNREHEGLEDFKTWRTGGLLGRISGNRPIETLKRHISAYFPSSKVFQKVGKFPFSPFPTLYMDFFP